MTLKEAIKSGKCFKREDWKDDYWLKCTRKLLFDPNNEIIEVKTGKRVILTPEDIISEDWILKTTMKNYKLKIDNERLENKIAAAIAHRCCTGSEHDPESGKLHGYCVVCGVEWPCETAKSFIFVKEK